MKANKELVVSAFQCYILILLKTHYRNANYLSLWNYLFSSTPIPHLPLSAPLLRRLTFPQTFSRRPYLLKRLALPPRLPHALQLIHLSMYPASPLSLFTLARSIAPHLVRESLLIVSSCLEHRYPLYLVSEWFLP